MNVHLVLLDACTTACALLITYIFFAIIRARSNRSRIKAIENYQETARSDVHLCPLSEPINEELNKAEVTSWRLAYRRYRVGEHHGSRGDITSMLKSHLEEGDHFATSNIVIAIINTYLVVM
jgi:hypothetical protein